MVLLLLLLLWFNIITTSMIDNDYETVFSK
jgi:hypothetical protein